MSDRDEAIEAARAAIEAHDRRADVRAIRLHRVLSDLKMLEDRLDQHLSEWPDAPDRLGDLLEQVRGESRTLEAELDELIEAAAPNLRALVGPNLAASLIAEAGGVDDLARMPTSRIQVLGAKKAVIRHLEGAPPPKHGVLYLHPKVGGADDPGQAAKDLAALVALAARADAFSDRDIAEHLKTRLADLEP